jgi:hypothetical protein
MVFLTKMKRMVAKNMCDTNKNVTKIDMIIKGVYYIKTYS